MKEFYKYHGAGNNFILMDNRDFSFDVKDIEKIKFLCDRHKGIGGDGLILLEPSDNADCFMNYYNSDGTLAEMCGNGVRCTAKFFLEQTRSSAKELEIDTRAGIKKIIVNEDETFSVNMGTPVFSHSDFPDKPLTLFGNNFEFVSMGNPHAVSLVKDLSGIDILATGPKVEQDPHLRSKVNVEFVEKITDDYFKVKVGERGWGATLACGTGACAVYAVITRDRVRQDLTQKEITLEFPGGKLYLSENEKGEIILRGPAVCVFKGEMQDVS